MGGGARVGVLMHIRPPSSGLHHCKCYRHRAGSEHAHAVTEELMENVAAARICGERRKNVPRERNRAEKVAKEQKHGVSAGRKCCTCVRLEWRPKALVAILKPIPSPLKPETNSNQGFSYQQNVLPTTLSPLIFTLDSLLGPRHVFHSLSPTTSV